MLKSREESWRIYPEEAKWQNRASIRNFLFCPAFHSCIFKEGKPPQCFCCIIWPSLNQAFLFPARCCLMPDFFFFFSFLFLTHTPEINSSVSKDFFLLIFFLRVHTSPATCTQTLLLNMLLKTQVPPGRKKTKKQQRQQQRHWLQPQLHSTKPGRLLAAADGDWMLTVEKCQVLCHSTVPGTHSCTGAMNINHWLWTALSSKLEIQYGILLTKTHTQTGCLFIFSSWINLSRNSLQDWFPILTLLCKSLNREIRDTEILIFIPWHSGLYAK